VKRTLRLMLFLAMFLTLTWAAVFGDDSNAEVTPTGLRFIKLNQVSVEREDLFVSKDKVEVSMIFKNNSNKDISTTIAFPIPDNRFSLAPPGETYFEDFSVEVDGHPLKYQTEVRAFAHGRECTKILRDMGISIQHFANFYGDSTKQFSKLSARDKALLINSGIVEDQTGWPQWIVKVKYYWPQTFPANKVVTIKHRYTPRPGFQYLSSSDKAFLRTQACAGEDILTTIDKSHSDKNIGSAIWVSYILKSALNWAEPIKAFHLTIEKPEDAILSTCFEHRFSKTSDNVFEETINNFIPKSDLSIFFIQLDKSDK